MALLKRTPGKKKLKLKWTQVDNLARLVVTWGLVSGVGRQGEDDDGMFVGASLLWLSSYSTQQWHLVDCCNNRSHSSPEIYNANTVRKFVSLNLFSKSWFTQYKMFKLFIQSQLRSGSLEGETKSFILVYRSLICIHLGVTVNWILSWNQHVDQPCKKLCSDIHVTSRIQQSCNLETAKSVHHALFESHLRYGIAVWRETTRYHQHQPQEGSLTSERANRCLAELNFQDSCREA